MCSVSITRFSTVVGIRDTAPAADPGFWKGGGAPTSAEGASFLGGCGGMLPHKSLKIWVSKIAISSILRQISYSFNTRFC